MFLFQFYQYLIIAVKGVKIVPKVASRGKKKTVTAVKSETKGKQYKAVKTGLEGERRELSHAVAFWGLAGLLFLPPYFRGLFFQPEQERALIFAGVVFWLAWLWKWSKRDCSFLSHPLDYFVLAFPAVYLVSAFQAANHGLAVDEAVKTVLYFLVYWLASRLVRNEKDIITILHVIYLSAAGVALAGLATATGVIHINDGFLNGRIYSTFQYPNALASFLAAVTFIGLYFWRRAGSNGPDGAVGGSQIKGVPAWLNANSFYQYLYAAGNFLLFAVFLGTRSNGGFIVFAIVFALFMIGLPKGSRIPVFIHFVLTAVPSAIAVWQFLSAVAGNKTGAAWLWVLAGLVLALAGQALYKLGEDKGLLQWIAKNKTTVFALSVFFLAAAGIGASVYLGDHGEAVKALAREFRLRNATERMCFFQDAMKMFKERPFLGWGGGGWQEAYRAYQSYLYNSNQVHGHYFQIMVETGIPGLLVILGIWASFLHLAHRLYHGAKENTAVRFLVWTVTVAAVSIGLHAVIDFDLSLSALALVLWTMFGLARGMSIYSVVKADDKKKKKYAPPNYFVLGAASAACVLIILFGGLLAAAGNCAAQASKYARSQDLGKAVALLQKASAYNPFNADYHSNLARIYQAQGKLDDGAVEAKKAVELSKYSAQRYADLAGISYNAEKNPDAAAHAEKAVQLAPFQIQWYEMLSRTYFIAGYNELTGGNRDAAKQYFEKAAQVPAKIQNQMDSLSDTEKMLWKDAPALSATPGIKLNVGTSQYILGMWTEAEANLRDALQDEKSKGEAALWLSVLKGKQGKEQEAQDLLEQAEKLVPQLAQNYESLKSLQVFVTE